MRIEFTVPIDRVLNALDAMAELPPGVRLNNFRECYLYSFEEVYSEDAYRTEITFVISTKQLDKP